MIARSMFILIDLLLTLRGSKHFRPEFLNRVNEVIILQGLDEGELVPEEK